MSEPTAVRNVVLPGRTASGKVRDLFDLGDRLMIVASDRISAFDVVMNEPVPGKGVLLTALTRFWLARLGACTPHHLDYVVDGQRCPRGYEAHRALLRDRAMVCRKTSVLPIECVVRGYLAGGGWSEYTQRGSVSGIALRAGMQLAERLPEPIFTPSTKATSGHDEPISYERACAVATEFATGLGLDRALAQRVMPEVRRRALAIYAQAARHAEARGILLADTKFEFGLLGEEILLIDEVLTPDSSRFWPRAQWRPGVNPPSYDKQFLRDYLNTLPWPKTPPPPPIPAEILAQTAERYREALRLLTA